MCHTWRSSAHTTNLRLAHPAAQIQSVVKPPAVSNGRKGFSAALAFIGTSFSLICITAYWVGLLLKLLCSRPALRSA